MTYASICHSFYDFFYKSLTGLNRVAGCTRRQINSFLHKQLSNDKVIRGPFAVRLRFVYGPFTVRSRTFYVPKQFGINLFEDELSCSVIAVFDAFGN